MQIGTTRVEWANGINPAGSRTQVIAGHACWFGTVQLQYHRHMHLSIFVDGTQLAIPNSIGRVPGGTGVGCSYGVHTHDTSGKVHVEPLVGEPTPTLGALFEIWGQPLTTTDVAGLTGLPIVVYVHDDGEAAATIFTGDPATIELISRREITIQVGATLAEIPTYVWGTET